MSAPTPTVADDRRGDRPGPTQAAYLDAACAAIDAHVPSDGASAKEHGDASVAACRQCATPWPCRGYFHYRDALNSLYQPCPPPGCTAR